MMENVTDTVDMDLDDNMLVEDSELPSSLQAQSAITSSSYFCEAFDFIIS
jgi:hypothetical protein